MNEKAFNLDVETLTTLIEKLEASPFNYLKVENQDIKIAIGKNGAEELISAERASVKEATVPAPQMIPEAAQAEAAASGTPAATATLEKPAAEQSATVAEEGVVQVKATTTGIFYAQPEPGAAPYVKVGDQIDEQTTIGLIEIMKVYSAVTSDVTGEVVAIHVEDAQLVEYGEPLLSVKVK